MSLKQILLSALLTMLGAGIGRAETVAGPVEAHVLRVVDGDTFVAEALVWPGHRVKVSVRIRGIDAPEMRSRCAAEKKAALAARAELARLIGDAPVTISNIGGGKYYGRVLADVTNAQGRPLDTELLRNALVRPYGGGRRSSYCAAG